MQPNLLSFICLCYHRFVTSLVYYGVSLNVGNFGLDIYLTQLIFGIAELPARLSCFPLIQRFGRKICQSGVLLLGGIACLVIPAIPASMYFPSTNLKDHHYHALFFVVVFKLCTFFRVPNSYYCDGSDWKDLPGCGFLYSLCVHCWTLPNGCQVLKSEVKLTSNCLRKWLPNFPI